MLLSEIAEYLDGEIEGQNDIDIISVGKIEDADKNEITFISNPLYEKHFQNTHAGAVLVSNNYQIKNKRDDLSIVRVDDPYRSFLKLLELFNPDEATEYEISESSVIHESTELPDEIFIGNFVSIGKNCKINNHTKILSNTTIESGVTIGENCLIYPNVVVYKNCVIGNNVIIHSGSVIGSDGFGNVRSEDGVFKKIPQTGIVRIEDDVEIGSNCSIDRATIGETYIGKGVKLDNQIQIAHNVFIDENTAIAAQVGIAGSAKIGKRCLIGGQSGIVGHITICDDVTIGASVGVSKSIKEPGLYTGYRAAFYKDNLRQEAALKNIHSIEKRIKELEKTLKSIKPDA
jgi:UDP-3-O-[3-hydroxymyristoyl] glucosamine N-acyltransferase